MIICRIFSAVILVICHFSSHSMTPFVHCKTGWETNKMATYTHDAPGRTALSADMSKIVELKVSDGFVISYGGSPLTMESAISGAITTILNTNTGMDLFKTLITKLSLRREAFFYIHNALDRYNQNIQKNCLSAAAGALYRIAKIHVGSVAVTSADINRTIKLLSSAAGFKEIFDRMLLLSDWETKCHELLAIPAPTKDLGDPDDEDHKLLTNAGITPADLDSVADPYRESAEAIKLLGLYFNTTKIQIANEKMSEGHCYYMASDGTNIINIHFPSVKDTEVYALPDPTAATGTKITRTFQLIGEVDQTVDVDMFNLNRRFIAGIEEILFHEGGHCLHGIENRDDVRGQNDAIAITYNSSLPSGVTIGTDVLMETDISADLITDWINPEEFRNGTGIVIMKDGSLQKDMICTYKYDKDRGREPRWPYRGVTTPATTVGDFVNLVKVHVHP